MDQVEAISNRYMGPIQWNIPLIFRYSTAGCFDNTKNGYDQKYTYLRHSYVQENDEAHIFLTNPFGG
jgi:hypothetical protein